MCNACGNHCCGSDEFGGCGCDGCFEPDCWSEEDEDLDDDGYPNGEIDFCRCAPAPGFRCTEVGGP